NVDLRVRNWPSNRNRFNSRPHLPQGGPDRCFCRSIKIPKLGTAFEQTICQVARETLASTKDFQPITAFPAAFQQKLPGRWSGLHDRWIPSGNQSAKTLAIQHAVSIRYYDLSANCQWKKYFQ